MVIILVGFLLLIIIGFIIFIIANQQTNQVETKPTNPVAGEEKRSPAFHLFLYLLSFLSLGFLVAGILGTMFQFVNKHFKEELDIVRLSAAGFDSGALKFAISSLLVAGPVYFAVLWFINKKLAKNEIQEHSLIRKYITYIALFAFSAMGLGSLVSLIYNYLDGELSQRSFIKIALFFLVSLFFGLLYFWEVRRKVFTSKQFQTFYYGAITIAVVSLLFGFTVVDPPKVARQKKIDQEIVTRIQMVNDRVRSFRAENDKLPDADSLDIPEGISYRVLDQRQYELCTTFMQSAESQYPEDVWAHPAGEHCFKFDKDINEPKGGLRPVPALVD